MSIEISQTKKKNRIEKEKIQFDQEGIE